MWKNEAEGKHAEQNKKAEEIALPLFHIGRRHLGKIPTLIQPRFHLDEL